tara:strand:+ start:1660 stop:1827 length:168 start_codon:yes stop_codon:yes gene_type:complete
MLTINKNTNKIFNLKDEEIINNHNKYVLLWKKKYNINIAKKEEKIEDKILKFIKS